MRVGKEDVVTSARQVKEFMASSGLNLPEGMTLNIVTDSSVSTQTRIATVAKSLYGAGAGAGYSCAVSQIQNCSLGCCRHPYSYPRGADCVPGDRLTISSLTVMGFILVLGIVVDDAIVVGERIHAAEQKGSAKKMQRSRVR